MEGLFGLPLRINRAGMRYGELANKSNRWEEKLFYYTMSINLRLLASGLNNGWKMTGWVKNSNTIHG
jgi:hypothetical protein